MWDRIQTERLTEFPGKYRPLDLQDVNIFLLTFDTQSCNTFCLASFILCYTSYFANVVWRRLENGQCMPVTTARYQEVFTRHHFFIEIPLHLNWITQWTWFQLTLRQTKYLLLSKNWKTIKYVSSEITAVSVTSHIPNYTLKNIYRRK